MRVAFKKHGFGIMEVLAAAVVLGFLIVGLNHLQKGNREAILRIRARDAANFVAQHILDSLGSVGINSIVPDADSDDDNVLFDRKAEENNGYKYSFKGKNVGDVTIEYDVKVEILPEDLEENEESKREIIESTYFTIANRETNTEPSKNEINEYAKSLKATVSWMHRGSKQSIEMAKVVR